MKITVVISNDKPEYHSFRHFCGIGIIEGSDTECDSNVMFINAGNSTPHERAQLSNLLNTLAESMINEAASELGMNPIILKAEALLDYYQYNSEELLGNDDDDEGEES